MSWTHSKVAAAIGFVGFFVLASSSATQGCATTTLPETADVAFLDSAVAADSATDTGAVLDTDEGLGDADSGDGRLDGGNFEAGTPPDAGPMPEVGCGGGDAASDADGATDGGEVCPLPKATCVGNWIVSYISSVCVDGACTFVRVLKDCAEEGASSCGLTPEGATCRFVVGK